MVGIVYRKLTERFTSIPLLYFTLYVINSFCTLCFYESYSSFLGLLVADMEGVGIVIIADKTWRKYPTNQNEHDCKKVVSNILSS